MIRRKMPITTDASGAATVYSDAITGRIAAITAMHGDLAATADITITDVETGMPILTITNLTADGRYQPRLATHDATGAAITGGADMPPVAGQLKAVVAQGGDTKSGVLHIYVLEDA